MSLSENKPLFQCSQFFAAFALLFLLSMPAFSQDDLPFLNVYVYENPGETHLNSDGKVVGSTADQVRAFLDTTGLKYEMYQWPWVRLYRHVLQSPNALAVDLLRTKEREDKFEWIYPISLEKQFLVGRVEDNHQHVDLEGIKAGKYSSVCDEGSAQCDFLLELGFPEEKILKVFGLSHTEQARMVISGRADYIILEINDIREDMKRFGADPDALVQVKQIRSIESYVVGSKNLDPRLLAILKQAADKR